MVSWIVRGGPIVSGTVTGWFVSKDAPNFSFIQGMASLVVIAVVVCVLAFWPRRWTEPLDRRDKPDLDGKVGSFSEATALSALPHAREKLLTFRDKGACVAACHHVSAP